MPNLMDGAPVAEPNKDEVPENIQVDISGNSQTNHEGKTVVDTPAGLDPMLWDSEKGVLKTEDMIKAYQEQKDLALKHRKTISKGLNAPEKADDYILEFKSKAKDMPLGDDVVSVIKRVAHENSLSQEQALNVFDTFLGEMIEAGKIEAPKSEEEISAQQEKYLLEQKKSLGENADKMLGTIKTYAETSLRRGQFSEQERDLFLETIGKNAETVKLGLKMLQQIGEMDIPVSSHPVDGLPSDREIADGMKAGKYTQVELEKLFAMREKAGRPQTLSADLF